MYGAAPEDESPKRKGHTWLYILLVLAGFFVFESLNPVMRLRSDPPPSVVGAKTDQNESQSHMARACWDYAIGSVQKVYPFGRQLPKDPPPRLRSLTGKASAISVLCWPRLRVAWTQRESWVEVYEWNTGWLTDPNGFVQVEFRNFLKFLGITH